MTIGSMRAISSSLLGGAALSALAIADPAAAQEASRATSLEEIRVEGEGRGSGGGSGDGTARGPVDGYVAKRSSAGTKTDTPILETPRSVEVIGRQELEDRAVTTIPEAVRYSPGVTTNGSGFDPRFDQIAIRGFPVNTFGDYKDGLRQAQGSFATFRTEPFQLERIDIIKGPAAVLYGQMTPGGLINRISKRPTDTPQFEAIGTIASTGRYEAGVDASGPLNADRTLMGRVVALGRVGELDFDARDDRMLLAPSFTWAPTDETRLTVYGVIQKDETESNIAVLNRPVTLDIINIRASDPKYDYLKQKQYQAGYEFEHAFDETFTVRSNARYNYLDMTARYLTGGVLGGGFDPARPNVYRRGSFAIDETVEATQIDNQLQAKFDTGAVRHTMLFGLDHQWSRSEQGQGQLAANPNYEIDVTAPVFGLSGPTPSIQRKDAVSIRQLGVYAQDQISFDRWRLTAGVRHDWASRKAENIYALAGAPGGAANGVRADRDDDAFSYNVGLLYAFDNGFSPYVSYATSFLPSSSKGSQGELLKPTEGEQIEGGVKFQPPGSKSLFTAAVYKLTEKNAVRAVPATTYSIAIGEIETFGVELGARANLAQGFDLIAAYNYNDAEITKDQRVPDPANPGGFRDNVGNQPVVTPKHTASLWADYTFEMGALDGFGLGAGVRYVGKSFGDSANSVKNDAYTLLDAGARYDFGKANPKLKGLMASVNATNLADKDAPVCNLGRCYLSQGRTVIGTLRYRW
ncbi:TonB-dependent siderophore receptor [Methylopila sp. M107]|uniref:TonB-dependent siderophore receptor n=1 Tax=Methylopila sp. M107 TaxID=1101190 RepID=UPI000381DEED|nr:TonB-dependent siderophore receptor [Methylopila sp. M107]